MLHPKKNIQNYKLRNNLLYLRIKYILNRVKINSQELIQILLSFKDLELLHKE